MHSIDAISTKKTQTPHYREQRSPISIAPVAPALGRAAVLNLQRQAGNTAVTALVQRDPVAEPSQARLTSARSPSVQPTSASPQLNKREPDKSKPRKLSETISDRLMGLFSKLRTARIITYLMWKQSHNEAQRTISSAMADVKRFKREAARLKNRIAKSGGGSKVLAQLAAAEAEIRKTQGVLLDQKATLRAAQASMKAEAAAATGLLSRIRQLLGIEGIAKEKASSKLWQAIGKVVKVVAPDINKVVGVLEGSAVGAKLVAVLAKLKSPWVGRTLIGVAALFEGISSYLTSQNRTQTGKIADAALTAGAGALVAANPVTALADFALPKDYKLSALYRGGSGAVTSLAEGFITGETASMEGFHESSKRGDYGKLMQVSSEAGDFWAEHGVIGGLKEFGLGLRDWL